MSHIEKPLERGAKYPPEAASTVPGRRVPAPLLPWDLASTAGVVLLMLALSSTKAHLIAPPLQLILAATTTFFLPGYALTCALFVYRNDLRGLDRVVASVALSLSIDVFVGLVLNFSGVRITGQHLLYGLEFSTLVSTVVAYFRRARVAKDKRFSPLLVATTKDFSCSMRSPFAFLIAALALACLGALFYAVASHQAGEAYSEFAVANPVTGKTDVDLSVSPTGFSEFRVSVTNHEGKTQPYWIAVLVDGRQLEVVTVGEIANKGRWDRELKIPVSVDGSRHGIQLELRETVDGKAYRQLRLWLDPAGGD